LADRFALFVAVVNRHTDRDTLIRELTSSVPDHKFRTVRLTESTTDILDEVLCQAGSPPGPVMVVDFDAAIPSDATYHPILQALNLRRPEWPRVIPHPVIFWMPEYVFTLLAREAPDFLDWRSLSVFFTDATERDLIPLRSDVWDGGLNTHFTRSERMARVAELESRLSLYEAGETDARIQAVRGEWLNELGLHQQHLGNPKKAIASFSEALAVARQNKNRQWEGATLGNIGVAWADLGDAHRAIGYHEQALAIAREIGDRRREGQTLGNLGNAWLTLGDARRALDYYEARLAIARETENRRGEGTALGYLGVVWADLGDAHRAIGYHEQALAIARETGDKRGEGTALGNLGVASKNLGDARKAIEFNEQALAIAREIGDRRREGQTLGNLGLAWAALGDAHKAIDYHEQNLSIARESGDRRREANASFNQALALHQLGQSDKAIRLAERALNIFTEIDSPYTETVRQQLAEWRGEVAGN
jgi:tetratricopeptide (TPR) repeat protein